MRRCAFFGLTAFLVLAFTATGTTWAERPKEGSLSGVSPAGGFCVTGPTLEEARALTPIEAADGLAMEKLTQDGSLRGRFVSAVQFSYESQPAAYIEFPTEERFPPEIIYMAEQFQPKHKNAWIRVDFSAMVSVTPAPGDFAGVAYALYVKEDGGDCTIENPGEMACGGDDVCGYLDQTYVAPWLVATSDKLVWASVARSDFFKARARRKVEVQVHLFPIHEDGDVSGEVLMMFGLMAFTSGK